MWSASTVVVKGTARAAPLTSPKHLLNHAVISANGAANKVGSILRIPFSKTDTNIFQEIQIPDMRSSFEMSEPLSFHAIGIDQQTCCGRFFVEDSLISW